MEKSHALRKFIKGFILIATIVIISLLIFFFYKTEVTINVDDYTYNLPFGINSKYRVVQGYGGLFSHIHIAALDFEMPEGTPIFAARDGILYMYKDDSNEGGPFPKYQKQANYIIIKHDDGSYGCYWHLKFKGVLIRSGHIKKGQLIGYSGRTGFVMQPHLHFSVKRKLNYEMNSFVKTKFRTSVDTEFLTVGNVYERTAE